MPCDSSDMPYDSEAIARSFYAALTPAGLARRTRADWDALILRELAELLPPASRILDVGCGYGRIAVGRLALLTPWARPPRPARKGRRRDARPGAPCRGTRA